MKIILESNTSLDLPGVYKILNTINDKFYIGSTTMKLYKRLEHHYLELRRNNHKNKYLQNAVNKYGLENFQFIGLQNVEKTNCLCKEQELIDFYKIENIYNINPLASGTPNMSKEVIEKRNKSITETRNLCCAYFRKIKNKETTIDEVPIKYKKWTNMFLNMSNNSWNKGKKQGEIDYFYLKGIKKKDSEKRRESRKKISEDIKNKIPVYVYDINNNYLGFWKNAYELEKESNNDDFILIKEMILKNKIGRNGYKYHTLKTFNVQKSINKGITYKGLIFKNKPLHEVIHVE